MLLFLALLRLLLDLVAVPNRFLQAANVLSTAVFVSAPVFALSLAAQYRWTWKRAVVFFVSGLVIHFGLGTFVGVKLLHGHGFWSAVCLAIGPNLGLVMWCVGLGVFLASILKDRNLIIPVSIFLIGFDIFLVLTPVGITKHLVQRLPEAFHAVAYSIPAATSAPTGGPVSPYAYIGPADFLFMGMFFTALHRFGMRMRETVLWLIPTLLAYLVLAYFFADSVPLLVPIGGAVLAVNAREFKMTKEEKLSSLGVAVLVALVIAGSVLTRVLRPGPSRQAPVPTVSRPGESPVPSAPEKPR